MQKAIANVYFGLLETGNDKAEHPQKYVIDDDKRKCAHCKATRRLDEFRNEHVTCNRCLEVNKGAQSKGPEMKAVYNWARDHTHVSIVLPYPPAVKRFTAGSCLLRSFQKNDMAT